MSAILAEPVAGRTCNECGRWTPADNLVLGKNGQRTPQCKECRRAYRRLLDAGAMRRGSDTVVSDPAPAMRLRTILDIARRNGHDFDDVFADAAITAVRGRRITAEEREMWLEAFHGARGPWRSAYRREGGSALRLTPELIDAS